MSESSTPKNIFLYNQVVDRALIVKDAVSTIIYITLFIEDLTKSLKELKKAGITKKKQEESKCDDKKDNVKIKTQFEQFKRILKDDFGYISELKEDPVVLDVHSIETETNACDKSTQISLLQILNQNELIGNTTIKMDLLPIHNNISTKYQSYINNNTSADEDTLLLYNSIEMEIEDNDNSNNQIPSFHDSDTLTNITLLSSTTTSSSSSNNNATAANTANTTATTTNNNNNNNISVDLSPIDDSIEEFDIFNDIDNEYQLDSIVNISGYIDESTSIMIGNDNDEDGDESIFNTSNNNNNTLSIPFVWDNLYDLSSMMKKPRQKKKDSSKYKMKISIPSINYFDEYNDEEKDILLDKYRGIVTDEYMNKINDDDDNDSDNVVIDIPIHRQKKSKQQQQQQQQQQPPPPPPSSYPVYNTVWTESELKLLKDEINLNDIDMIDIWNNENDNNNNNGDSFTIKEEEKEREEREEEKNENKMEEEEEEEEANDDCYYYEGNEEMERIDNNNNNNNNNKKIEVENDDDDISNTSILSFDLFDKYINELTDIYTFIFKSNEEVYSIPLYDEEFKRWTVSRGWNVVIHKITRPEYIISSLIYFINDLNITSKDVQYMLNVSDNHIMVKNIK